MKELIHFAHGNGFPSPCYQQMFNHLSSRFNYCYIDKIGHNPDYPVGDNWNCLVSEVLESIKMQTRKPVIAVGHSLGGILSLLASIQQPELFKAVILLDSPLIGPFKSTMVKLAKRIGFIDRVTPASRTRARKAHWKTRDEVVSYLRSRDLFKQFAAECLKDYIDYGLVHNAEGYHLRFNRDIEYQIYRTIPHVIPQYEGTLAHPCALIYGDRSWVVDKMDVGYMQDKFKINCYKTIGGHLFPREHPKAAAMQIIAAMDAII